MYASTHVCPTSYASLFRTLGRLGGIIVMASWIAMVLREAWYQGAPPADGYFQAGALAVVFAGYIVGWWKEILGGALAVVGTMAFYAVCMSILDFPPLPEAAMLAAPGIFYMLAHRADKKHEAWQG